MTPTRRGTSTTLTCTGGPTRGQRNSRWPAVRPPARNLFGIPGGGKRGRNAADVGGELFNVAACCFCTRRSERGRAGVALMPAVHDRAAAGRDDQTLYLGCPCFGPVSCRIWLKAKQLTPSMVSLTAASRSLSLTSRTV